MKSFYLGVVAVLVFSSFGMVAQSAFAQTSENLALNRPTDASSNPSIGALAVDGQTNTRWGSGYSDPHWFSVDLGASYALNRIYINWEVAYGKAYQIQVSDDAQTWTTIYSTASGDGGIDDITLSGTGRYVRMYGTQRGTKWGYSMWEFEVYGSVAQGDDDDNDPMPVPPTPGSLIKILPLGDSITAMTGDSSYRLYLGEMLSEANYSYTFIGTQSDAAGSHEGHSGWKAEQIRDALPGWLSGYTPDVVLLHIGTNDALGNQSAQSTINEIEQIIDRLRADNPDVKIVLAKIIPLPPRESIVAQQNALTDALAAQLTTAQSPIVVADHFTPLNPDTDLRDPCNCHPNALGAPKMAQAWFEGIETLYPTGTTTEPALAATLTATPTTITVGATSTLSWSSTNATSCSGINFATANATSGSISVVPIETTSYSLQCVGEGGNEVSKSATVTVSEPTSVPAGNLALNRPTDASSNPSIGALAVDGQTNTRWGSGYSDPHWFSVDLGASYALNRIYINWEVAYGKAYQIQVSDDAQTWTTIYSTASGDGGIDDITLSGTGRYVRMYGTQRGTKWGYSMWEFEVYGSVGEGGDPEPEPEPDPEPTVNLLANPTTITEGESTILSWSSTDADVCSGTGFSTSGATSGSVSLTPTVSKDYSITCTGVGGSDTASTSVTVVPQGGTPAGNLALNRPTNASTNQSIAERSVDGDTNTRWGSTYSDPQWFYVDLGASYALNRIYINWEVAYGKAYQIQVSDDAQTWTTIYSTASGDGGIDDITLSGTGRYVRMYGTQRGTKWGYSMWEFEVYGN